MVLRVAAIGADGERPKPSALVSISGACVIRPRRLAALCYLHVGLRIEVEIPRGVQVVAAPARDDYESLAVQTRFAMWHGQNGGAGLTAFAPTSREVYHGHAAQATAESPAGEAQQRAVQAGHGEHRTTVRHERNATGAC